MRLLPLSLLLALTLASGAAFAQTPAAAAQPAPAASAPPAQVPFPRDSKFAFLNIQRIANDSAEGKVSTSKVKAFNDKKVAELNDKNKALQTNQQKLAQGGTVLSDSARALLEKEIERQQVDIQRFTQDAQADVQEMQQNLQIEFQKKLIPVIDQIADDLQLYMIFSQGDAGLVWADQALDITDEVIKRFDAASRPAAAAKPSAPAAPATPPAKPPIE